MSSRIASIDIGTNTALLLIAELQDNALKPIRQIEQIVRLGEGVDENRVLKEPAMDRVLAALEDFLRLAEQLKCRDVLITGTSAVRDASNKDVLLQDIRARFGLDMRILSGEEEARLTYLGALSNKTFDGDILLLDIGGGSTEFTIGNQHDIHQAISLDIGSVRLTERFLHHDPVSDEELNHLERIIRSELHRLDDLQALHPVNFVGVAGTVTTLAAMHLKLDEYDSDAIDNCPLTIAEVRHLVASLFQKTLTERKKIQGLHPKRADVILAGAVILHAVLQHFRFEKMVVSERGLRYGVALQGANLL